MILGLINRAIYGYLVISCFCVFICFTHNPNLAQADELGMNLDVGSAPSLNDTAKKQAEKKWSVSGSAGIQFDDNVNSDPVDTTSDEDDIAAVLDVSLGYQLLKKSFVDLDVSYDFSHTRYKELVEFDIVSHTGSMYAAKEVKGADLSIYYGYTRSYLSGDDFLGLHNTDASVGYALTDIIYGTLSYNNQHKDFVTANERDSILHGNEITGYYFFNEAKSFLKLAYRFEIEDTVGSEFDFNAHYGRIGVRYGFDLPLIKQVAALTLDYEFHKKFYDSLTLSIADKRIDSGHYIKLGTEVPLNEHLVFLTNYEHSRVRSNLDSTDLDQNIITFSMRASY